MTAAECLSRTLLLARDELRQDVSDETILTAFLTTTVVLVARGDVLESHSGRVAFAATAQLAARSGAQVFLDCPLFSLEHPLPPLEGTELVTALEEFGRDLIPGVEIRRHVNGANADAVVLFGAAQWEGRGATHVIRVGASKWSASLGREVAEWASTDWPMGGLGAAALASAEIFKLQMRKLRRYARFAEYFNDAFSATEAVSLDLCPEHEYGPSNLGRFDLVSAGAIAQATLFCLAQIPGVRGSCRAIEKDTSDIANLNRNMFLRRSRVGLRKADDLAGQHLGRLLVEPVCERYDHESVGRVGVLAADVLVGVDDIPSRWFIQEKWPSWLGIGATSHFSALVSHHKPGQPCARCLHHKDEPTAGPLPTAACISFRAGVELAARFLRHRNDNLVPDAEQQIYVPVLRPEEVWRSPVSRRATCALQCGDRVCANA